MEHAYFSIPPRSVGTLARKNLTAKRSAIHGAPSSAATPSPTASTLLPSTAWDTRLQRKGGPASNNVSSTKNLETSSPHRPLHGRKFADVARLSYARRMGTA